MDLEEIKQIIALMKRNELSEFELENEGSKIRIKRGFGGGSEAMPVMTMASALPAPIAAPVAAPAAGVAAGKPVATTDSDLIEVKSPMVGTFYRAPSPEAAVFVDVGSEISEESVVCIIEAMKVMNEIKAEIKGTIVEVLVENAKAVEFGQPLFRVRKSA